MNWKQIKKICADHNYRGNREYEFAMMIEQTKPDQLELPLADGILNAEPAPRESKRTGGRSE